MIGDQRTNMAQCSKCAFSFCTLCKVCMTSVVHVWRITDSSPSFQRAYHGVDHCKISDMTKVLEEYEKAGGELRAELETRFGKATLQRHLVEYQSMRYVKGHSQACPYCRSLISKIDG